MSTLTSDITLTKGANTDEVGGVPPTSSTVGFQPQVGQNGFFIHTNDGPYILWLRGSSGWAIHQQFSSANALKSTAFAWGDKTAAYIQTSVSGHKFFVFPRTGSIIVDSDTSDGDNSRATLIQGSVSTPLNVAPPDSIPSSGVFSWSGQNTGLTLQTGEFSWSGEAIYDAITSITFHKNDASGVDQSAFLDQYLNTKSGQIRVNLDAHPGHRNVYQIIGASLDANGHYKFDVYNVSMDEPAVSSGTCTVYFVLVGEQGAQGPAGTDGISSNYTTSFNGPHSLGDDRDPGESLGAVTVGTGLSYQGGEYVIVSMDARPDSFDIAQVTSYDSSTGEMHFNNIYQSTNDSDSTVWNINLTGVPGISSYSNTDVGNWLNGNYDHHIIPNANAQYDLGNAEYKIRHLFLSDNSMYIGDTWIKAEGDSVKMENLLVGDLNLNNTGRQNEIDGTSGHWSIQEGAEDLFLINRTTGKKYRFNITEVEEN